MCDNANTGGNQPDGQHTKKMKLENIAKHVATVSTEARKDMAAGQWDEVMTDALYAACGAETQDEMTESRQIAEDAATKNPNEALRSIILSTRSIPAEMKLVRISKARAKDLMMAPSAAGGWVAVNQTADEDALYQSRYVALLPESMDGGEPVSLSEVQSMWAADINLEDAAALIGALPEA